MDRQSESGSEWGGGAPPGRAWHFVEAAVTAQPLSA